MTTHEAKEWYANLDEVKRFECFKEWGEIKMFAGHQLGRATCMAAILAIQRDGQG